MPTTITRTDPLRNFKFSVQFIPKAGGDNDTNLFGGSGNGSLVIGFAAVSGISVQNEVIPYREGGMNTHNHKMVGQSDFAPVTFSRGVFASQPQMWRWQQFMHRWNQAANVGENVGSNGSVTDYRCDIIVKVHDHPVTVNNNNYVNDASKPSPAPAPAKLAYRLFNCWPGGYALGDLNAGESSIIVQQLTVHHEGFVVAWDDTEIAALAG